MQSEDLVQLRRVFCLGARPLRLFKSKEAPTANSRCKAAECHCRRASLQQAASALA
jgi:hypothetical protein